MLFEELIPVIESNPEIWRAGYELFNNPSASDKAWEEIALRFSCDVDTIKKRWEDLKSQYRKELEETLAEIKAREDQGGRKLQDCSIDVISNKDSGTGRSQEDQAGVKIDQDSGKKSSIGSNLEVSDKEISDGDPSCSVYRLSEEGFNAMHFIRDQIISEIPSGRDNSMITPQKCSETFQSESLQTPESSHSLQSQDSALTPSNEASSTGYLIPIPLKILGELEGGHELFQQCLSDMQRLAIKEIESNPSELLAFAEALQKVGSDTDDDDDDDDYFELYGLQC
ncbi:hypothetical protein LSTR_LSTR012522 [Laodelphax striatellus]|uniref:MADF domain-containing protein n=1 Tax=Laodelphax striatellus TaxID=195883 RepID=A0A482XL95_LAOST|nr:hypothetical protein LSTR_LSTR012522 [Laodelphax striatellus]